MAAGHRHLPRSSEESERPVDAPKGNIAVEKESTELAITQQQQQSKS